MSGRGHIRGRRVPGASDGVVAVILIARLRLTLNIPSLARQRCLPSWGPRKTPWFFFFVISQLFDAVDYSNYVFRISETIIQ